MTPWPPPAVPPGQPATRGFTVPIIIGTWAAAWLVGNVVGIFVLLASGHGGTDPLHWPTWVVAASTAALWVPALAALVLVSRARGSGSWSRDFGLRARWVDLVGLPIGVGSQLVLVPLVTRPFTRFFPDTFSAQRVEERAKGLADMASGPWIALLAIVVVVGAPLVEELMYRGFIQLGLARRIGATASVLVAAAWFAIVHLSWPELPGLFAIALVLGVCTARTGRLGMSIAAHVAFNATGLLLVVLR